MAEHLRACLRRALRRRASLALALTLASCTPEGQRALADLVQGLIAVLVALLVTLLVVELTLALRCAVEAWRRQPSIWLWALSMLVLVLHGGPVLSAMLSPPSRPPDLFDRVLYLSFALPAFAALCASLTHLTQRRRYSIGLSLLLCLPLPPLIAARLQPVVPAQVLVPGTISALAIAPWGALCLLTSAGAVSCHEGPRGYSAVSGLSNVSALASGPQHLCALGAGQVLCIGPGLAQPTPIPALDDAVELLASPNALWVRRAAGQVQRYGDDHGFDGRPDLGALPKATAQLVGGTRFWCLREGEERVRCWAFSDALPALPGARALAATQTQVCALAPGGQVACYDPSQAWSARRFPPARCNAARPDPACGHQIPIPGVRAAVQLCAGTKHLCARSQDGQVRCWTDHAAVQYIPLPAPARSLAARERRTCALLEDSRVLCWIDAGAAAPPEEVLPPASSALQP